MPYGVNMGDGRSDWAATMSSPPTYEHFSYIMHHVSHVSMSYGNLLKYFIILPDRRTLLKICDFRLLRIQIRISVIFYIDMDFSLSVRSYVLSDSGIVSSRLKIFAT